MIRRTITTLTLAAVTTIAIATAAPALGAPPAADLSPSIDVPLIDPCVFSCLNIDWDLGGLLDPAPGSDDPADPGIVVDVPGIVVDPEILIVDVPLDPIIDLTPSAEGSDATDPAPTVEEDIERLAPIGPDELRELVGEATPLAPLAGTETAPSPEAGTSSTSSEDPHVESAPTPGTVTETPTTTVPQLASAPVLDTAESASDTAIESDEATVTTVDTVATSDVALETPSEDMGTRGGLDVALAALMGIAAVVALGATATGAYRIGRNRA